jgi:hypothetical protein
MTGDNDWTVGWAAAIRRNLSANAICSGVGGLGSPSLLYAGRLASRAAAARVCHEEAAALVLVCVSDWDTIGSGKEKFGVGRRIRSAAVPGGAGGGMELAAGVGVLVMDGLKPGDA